MKANKCCECGIEVEKYYRCKKCNSIYNKKYRECHHKELLIKSRERYWKDPEKSREMKRRSWAKKPEVYRDKSKAWYYKNRKNILLDIKNNREKRNAQWRRWWANSSKKTRDSRHQKDKIRRRSALGAINYISRREIFDRDLGICAYCGAQLEFKSWHMDHVLPLSSGGQHSKGNVVVSCSNCNLKKGKQTWTPNRGIYNNNH